MKNLLLTGLIGLFALSTNAQINLEHTYPTSPNRVRYTEVDNGVGIYYYLDNNGSIQIMDDQHQNIKSIAVPSVTNAELFLVSYLSKTLFDNTSSDYEYIAYYTDTVMNRTKIYIYDESGTGLKAVFDVIALYLYNSTAGTKMLVDKATGSEIYSLPGALVALKEQNSPFLEQYPFPNPTNGRVNLPATNGSEINVFDANGKLIESGNVDGETYQLDATEYGEGMYIYNTSEGEIGRFVKQ